MDVKITRDSEDALAAEAQKLTVRLMALALVYDRQILVTACVTTAAVLMLGRLLQPNDTEVLDIVTDFVQRIQDCKPVLREDATNTAPEPKQVM